MCCGVPDDMYDMVVITRDQRDMGDAFADAFLARERQERVAMDVDGRLVYGEPPIDADQYERIPLAEAT